MGKWEKEVEHTQWDGVDKTVKSSVDGREYLVADGHVSDIQPNVPHAHIIDDFLVHDRGDVTDIPNVLPCFVDKEIDDLQDIEVLSDIDDTTESPVIDFL